MKTGSAELAVAQTENWDISREMATKLQDSLQNLKEGEISQLLNALANVNGQLVSKPSQAHECITAETVQQINSELVIFTHQRQNEQYEVHVLQWPIFQPVSDGLIARARYRPLALQTRIESRHPSCSPDAPGGDAGAFAQSNAGRDVGFSELDRQRNFKRSWSP